MKNKYVLLFAAVVIFAPLSCLKFDERSSASSVSEEFTITVHCPTGDVKTSLQGQKPVWRAGDEVWISDGKNSCKAVIDQKFDNMEYAEFKVSGLYGDSLYVLYPYDSEAYVSEGKISVNVPSFQSGEFKDAGICFGACPSANPVLTLRSACPVLHFISNNETLETMQIDNMGQPVAGNMLVAAKSGEISTVERKAPCIRMDYGGRHNEFYLSLVPSVFSSGAKILFTTSENKIGKITMSQENELEIGAIYEMGNIDERIEFGSDPAVDLSARESANCYIVERGKSYRFKMVKGNSVTAVEDVAYAAVLWETVNTSVAPETHSLVDDVIVGGDRIFFNVPSSAPNGNALIAAYNKSGEIVWSWHIWIVNEGVGFLTFDEGAYLMDRNLGALTATPGTVQNYGLLYQWGRKDPFPSGQALTSNTRAKLAGASISTINSSGNSGTIEYSIKNPTKVIYNTTGASWLNEETFLWSADAKTQYDPCPPGYHIPTREVLNYASGGVWDGSIKALHATVNGNSVYFPAAGVTAYNTGDLSQVGSRGYYWYNSTQGSTATSSCVIRSDGFHFYSQGTNYYSPQAFSVRCQKISDREEVQVLEVTYNITMPGYLYMSPSITNDINSEKVIDWGDGTTSRLRRDSVALHHSYAVSGQYVFSMRGYDMDTFYFRSLSDVAEIDFSNL